MSALLDVQHTLNAIRDITDKEQRAVRLEVLRLLASTIADEARDIEGVKVKAAQPKQRSAVRSVPMPKSSNAPKLQQAAPKQPTQQQPNTQPIQPIKPIAPK